MGDTEDIDKTEVYKIHLLGEDSIQKCTKLENCMRYLLQMIKKAIQKIATEALGKKMKVRRELV